MNTPLYIKKSVSKMYVAEVIAIVVDNQWEKWAALSEESWHIAVVAALDAVEDPWAQYNDLTVEKKHGFSKKLLMPCDDDCENSLCW